MSEMTDMAAISELLGINHRPKGLRVSVTNNAVEIDVVHGNAGCVLTVAMCGLRINLPLDAAARDHLIKVLAGQPAKDHQAA